MKSCQVLALILFPFFAGGQNLVPNAGFEQYKHLPCEDGLYFMEALLKEWIQPIPTTPDYWNSLSAPDCLLNPGIVHDSARTGNAMIGIVTASFEAGAKSEYKEYVEVKLSSPVKKGGFYNVEFYGKSRGENPDPFPYAKFQANNLGAAFSDSLIHIQEGANSPDHLMLRPVVRSQEIVKSEWTKIGACVIPRNNYQYLLIGNFNSIDSTKLIQIVSGVADYSYTYYLIDDVVVEELQYDVSHLDALTPFCFDQPSVELKAFVNGATSYQWEDGSTEQSFVVSEKKNKDYFVTINFNECAYKHKFHVEYLPELDLGADTVLCSGESLDLIVNYPFQSFQWSDGSFDSIKHVSDAGIYSIATLTPHCNIQDSIAVEIMDCPGFAPNIITPNDDDLNEYFVFENIKYGAWSLTVYDRWGQRVYFSEDYRNNWSGDKLPNGYYYYKLHSPALHREVKGWVNVVR